MGVPQGQQAQTATYPASKFTGLLPVFDHATPRQVPGIIRGKNFRWKTNAVYSGFGNSVVAEINMPFVDHLAMYLPFYNGNILCTQSGIYSFDQTTKVYTLLFSVVPETRDNIHHDYPWTHAHVGNDWFYNHPAVGLVKYDGLCNTWSLVDRALLNTDPLQPIYAITHADNRLIFLLSDTVGWSCIDFGDSLRANAICGGGFQNLSLIRSGHPLNVVPYSKGFLTFTTNGIMISELSTDPTAAFVHRAFTFRNTALNPFCVIPFEDNDRNEVVWLGKNGFNVTAGGAIKKWKPEQGNYIEEYELLRSGINLDDFSSIKLWHVPEEELLFVSFYERASGVAISNRALVLHLELDKWSSFDQAHFTISEIYGTSHRGRSFEFGFLAPTMRTHILDESRTNAGFPLASFIELGPFKFAQEVFHAVMTDSNQLTLQMPVPALPIENAISHSLGQTFQPTTHHIDNWHDNRQYYSLPRVRVNGSSDGYTLFEQNWCDASISAVAGRDHNFSYNITAQYLTVSLHAEVLDEWFELHHISMQLQYAGRLF